MKSYKSYLLNENAQFDLEQVKGFINSLGFTFYDEIKNKSEGYIQTGSKKITLTIYSSDRLSTKEKLQNILKSNRIRFTEIKKSESSVKATSIGRGNDEIIVLYKPLKGTGGSGAGSTQTAIQETTQAIFLALSFNVLRKKISEDDIYEENLNKAYTFVDSNNIPLNEIMIFIEDKKWLDTFITTSNILFGDYFSKDKSYTFERGSDIINKLYNDFRVKSKEMNINVQGDKWNPADIWMISNTLSKIPNTEDLTDLNRFVQEKFLSKDLIGISLKKLSNKPKTIVLNLSKSENIKRFDKYVISPKSKDVYLNTREGDKVQFRSFNSLGGFQGEIIGSSAKHGKIGYSMISYFLSKYANSTLPQNQSEVKDKILKEDKTLYIEFANLWNSIIEGKKLSNEKDVLEYINSNSNNPEDFLFSKYISLKIVETINSMTPESRNSFMSDVFGFASSSSDFSSVFVKVY